MKQLLHFISGFALFFICECSYAQADSLLVFEGSDWCRHCIKFDKKILQDSNVTNYISNHNITLVKVDFPQKTKQTKAVKQKNKALAEQYQFDGTFPTILFTHNSSQKPIPYTAQSPEQFISYLRQLTAE